MKNATTILPMLLFLLVSQSCSKDNPAQATPSFTIAGVKYDNPQVTRVSSLFTATSVGLNATMGFTFSGSPIVTGSYTYNSGTTSGNYIGVFAANSFSSGKNYYPKIKGTVDIQASNGKVTSLTMAEVWAYNPANQKDSVKISASGLKE